MLRRPSVERSYARVATREVDPSTQSDKTNNKSPEHLPTDAKLKEKADPGRENLNNGPIGAITARPTAPRSADPKFDATSYNYGRERHPPADRYKDPPPSDYRRATYSTYEGRGGAHADGGSIGRGGNGDRARRDSDLRGSRDPPGYDKQRDPRDHYYSSPANHPTIPLSASEYRGRDDYSSRAIPPPLDDVRGPAPPPPAAYGERYPRGAPLDLEPPIGRGREGYRDLLPRQHDYGTKRKFDDPEFVDPYLDDYRV